MKAKVAIKLVLLGFLVVAIGYWLRGHDILTGSALVLLALVVLAKMVFAIVLRHGPRPPGSGGPTSADQPVPRPPDGRPPGLSAAADAARERAA